MQSNLQQQRQSIKKEGQTSPDIQTVTQNDGQKASTCPGCHAELPEEALFCPECGLSIKQRVCPKCGAPASPTADICQTCGAWLLEGKCKFCYADLSSSDALFCPECGKPKDGIPCPHCDTLSIFDFCSNCGKPVTEEAIAELKHAQEEMASHASSATPETSAVQAAAKKTFNSNQDARRWYNAQAAAQTAGIETVLAQLETLINSEPQSEEPEVIEDKAPVPAKKSLFSDRQMESIRKTGAVVDEITRQRLEAERIAEEERKAAEAERKRKEAERQRQIKEAQERKEALERQLRARAWRCNAYGAVHPGGPNECADPSRGGQWV
jgi:ribosomal protein L40E